MLDANTGAVAGYATWRHRDATTTSGGAELVIEIEWFGVDVDYQGERTEEGASIAGTLFETVELRARSHGDSTPDMPLVLEIDVANTNAQGFWEHLGFEFFEWAEVGPHEDRYVRMIRSASE